VSDPLGDTNTTDYDLAGHVTGTQDADNHHTTFLFDAAGRQTVVVDALLAAPRPCSMPTAASRAARMRAAI